MKCPECDGEMVSGTMTVDHPLPWWFPFRRTPAHLYFQDTHGRDAVLKYGEIPRHGFRCPKCQALIITGPNRS